MKNFNYLCLSLVLIFFACTKEVGMEENLTTNKIEVNTDGVEFAESSLSIDYQLVARTVNMFEWLHL